MTYALIYIIGMVIWAMFLMIWVLNYPRNRYLMEEWATPLKLIFLMALWPLALAALLYFIFTTLIERNRNV